LRDGRIATLVEEASGGRMAAAGNVAGELLNWIAMIGTVGERAASWISLQAQFGHAYAIWREAAA
jgi:hypothetical protein